MLSCGAPRPARPDDGFDYTPEILAAFRRTRDDLRERIAQMVIVPVVQAQFRVVDAFEASTRGAAVLGVVGAGGIGLQIAERIKIRYWDEVAFIVLLILATVAAIDAVSGRLRRRLMG